MIDRHLIDWDRVAELRSEIGEEGFAEVVALFLQEVDSALARLNQPAPQRLEDEMHFLKGSGWNLGFDAFAALCQAGERAAAGGEPGRIDISALGQCYARSRQSFLDGIGPAQVA